VIDDEIIIYGSARRSTGSSDNSSKDLTFLVYDIWYDDDYEIIMVVRTVGRSDRRTFSCLRIIQKFKSIL
jgi:hypothetical protein